MPISSADWPDAILAAASRTTSKKDVTLEPTTYLPSNSHQMAYPTNQFGEFKDKDGAAGPGFIARKKRVVGTPHKGQSIRRNDKQRCLALAPQIHRAGKGKSMLTRYPQARWWVSSLWLTGGRTTSSMAQLGIHRKRPKLSATIRPIGLEIAIRA